MFVLIAVAENKKYSLAEGSLQELDRIVELREGICWIGNECCQLQIIHK